MFIKFLSVGEFIQILLKEVLTTDSSNKEEKPL